MENLTQRLSDIFGNRIRVRVCGIAMSEGKVLLARHQGMADHPIWLPPGGGIAFEESLHEGLIREFKEETGLIVKVERFLFTYEIIRPPFHAIELFFHLTIIGGNLTIGQDPELGEKQSIDAVKWTSFDELCNWPIEYKHHLFQHCNALSDLLSMSGCYQYIEGSCNKKL